MCDFVETHALIAAMSQDKAEVERILTAMNQSELLALQNATEYLMERCFALRLAREIARS